MKALNQAKRKIHNAKESARRIKGKAQSFELPKITRQKVIVANTDSPISTELALLRNDIAQLKKLSAEVHGNTIPPVTWFWSLILGFALVYPASNLIIDTAPEYRISAWASGLINDAKKFTANRAMSFGVESVGGSVAYASPLKRKLVVTSHFNPKRKHPVTGLISPHKGTDYRCKTGDGVYAMRSGIIAAATFAEHAGNTVIINHSNGERSTYMHLDKIKTKAGRRVSTGERIGDCGATGRVTAPHLHVAIYSSDKIALNPVKHVNISNTADMWTYFKDTVAQSESRGSGDYKADNGIYRGRYQMGRDALKDAGYNNISWRAFLNSPKTQEDAYKKWQSVNLKVGMFGIETKNLNGFIKPETPAYKVSGFLHAAQFGATNALKWYTKGVDFKDGNGIKISEYARRGEVAFKAKYGKFASATPLISAINGGSQK